MAKKTQAAPGLTDLREGTAHYVQVPAEMIPQGVRFDTPGPNQGQMVEVSYGTFSRYEAGEGDAWKRVHDTGVGGGAPRFYQLAWKQ